jgi:hypothetical protein
MEQFPVLVASSYQIQRKRQPRQAARTHLLFWLFLQNLWLLPCAEIELSCRQPRVMAKRGYPAQGALVQRAVDADADPRADARAEVRVSDVKGHLTCGLCSLAFGFWILVLLEPSKSKRGHALGGPVVENSPEVGGPVRNDAPTRRHAAA